MGGGWWQEAESPADSGRASGTAGQQGWTARRATLGKTEEAEQEEVRKAPHSPAGCIEAITGPLTWFDHIKGKEHVRREARRPFLYISLARSSGSGSYKYNPIVSQSWNLPWMLVRDISSLCNEAFHRALCSVVAGLPTEQT